MKRLAVAFVAASFVALAGWVALRAVDGRLAPGTADGRSASGGGEGQVASATVEARGASGGVEWSDPVEIASGEGYQGPWRMNESDFRYVDGPTAHLDEDGSAWLAWIDQSSRAVLFQRFGPDGEPVLDEPANVSESPDVFSWLPRIARGAPGSSDIHLLWQEIVFLPESSHGGEILYSRSTDGGRSWSEPLNLSNTPAGAGKGRLGRDTWDNGSLDLVVAPDGTLLAAWSEYEGALRVSRSTDGGASFSDPVTVVEGDGAGLAGGAGGGATEGSDGAAGGSGAASGAPARGPALTADGASSGAPARGPALTADGASLGAPARGPALAADSEGVVHVAWTVGDDPEADIRIARSDDGGRSFGEPRTVHPGPGHADAPALAVDGAADGDGTLHLAFGESPEGPFGASEIRYARLPAGAENFEEARTLPAPDEGGGDESGGFPSLRLDGAGNPYLLWERFPDPRGRPEGLALTASGDGGETFASPSPVPGTHDPELGFNGSLQGHLARKLSVTPDGGVAVVNSTFLPSRESRVFLHRGRAAVHESPAVP